MTTSTAKRLIIAAFAAATLAIGSLAVTGDAMAISSHSARTIRSVDGGGMRGDGTNGAMIMKRGMRSSHKFFGHRWRGHFFFGPPTYVYDDTCYFVRKATGRLIKICSDYYYY